MRQQPQARLAVALAVVFNLTVLGSWSTAACALTISPVVVELTPGRRIISITVSNPGDQPVTFQAQTLAWEGVEGLDSYTETSDLLVVPPIATIAAGGTQVFRVTSRAPQSPQERAYRLILEDVTEMADASPATANSPITIRINHNLPVFISAPGKPEPLLRLGPCQSTPPALGRRTCVQLDNDGNRYASINSMTVDGAELHLALQGSSRVLAGAWRQWVFDLPPHFAGTLKAKAETSAGPVSFEWQAPGR